MLFFLYGQVPNTSVRHWKGQPEDKLTRLQQEIEEITGLQLPKCIGDLMDITSVFKN
jgi:hypothetical protein